MNALKTLLPILIDPDTGKRRLSKESTLHLLTAALGIALMAGYIQPGDVDVTQINDSVWKLVESVGGLVVLFHGLSANFRRHRENGGTGDGR